MVAGTRTHPFATDSFAAESLVTCRSLDAVRLSA